MTESRWINSPGPCPVRDIEDPDIPTDQGGQLTSALVVRAQRLADAQQIRAKPERVATLDRPWGRYAPGGRDAERRRPGLQGGRL
jgi:hypothetical protein